MNKIISNIARYLRRICKWVMEPKLAWATVLLLGLTLCLTRFVLLENSHVVVLGLLLQGLGILLTAHGLINLQKKFDKKTLSTLVREWLRRFPKWKEAVEVIVGQGKATAMGKRGRVSAWHGDDPSARIDHRIDFILKNLDHLRNDQKSALDRIVQIEERQAASEENSATSFENLEETTSRRMEELLTNDIWPSLAGLLLLFVGATMSALPGWFL